MIITITGKACSGKSTVSRLFAEKYGFDMFNMGDLFKAEAARRGMSAADFSVLRLQDPSFDFEMDKQLVPLGEQRKNDKLIVDSRVAWHFIPHSFKVFVDVEESVMVERLVNSDRTGKEKYTSKESAREALQKRMKKDAEIYKQIYNIDIMDTKNYDFVLDTSHNTPEGLADKLWEAYQNFVSSKS